VRRASLVSLVAAAALLAFPTAAQACNGWTEPNMETELMCPTCHQVLAYSDSPIASQIRKHLYTWCSAGVTSGQVKDRLVAQFGKEILASPPKSGFDLLAWLIPGVVILGGAGVACLLALRWTRGRRGPPSPPPHIDPAIAARIDADLAGYE
jgi:cytochrome c-type biogenesis protein CcmH